MNNDYEELIVAFKKAGWIMAILGGLGMLMRLIFTNERFVMSIWTKKIVAASIVGLLVFFSLHEIDLDEVYKSVICSISGSFAPELFDFVRNKFLSKLKENE
jgi:hypothetical protein